MKKTLCANCFESVFTLSRNKLRLHGKVLRLHGCKRLCEETKFHSIEPNTISQFRGTSDETAEMGCFWRERETSSRITMSPLNPMTAIDS